jgi:hypothetical protein
VVNQNKKEMDDIEKLLMQNSGFNLLDDGLGLGTDTKEDDFDLGMDFSDKLIAELSGDKKNAISEVDDILKTFDSQYTSPTKEEKSKKLNRLKKLLLPNNRKKKSKNTTPLKLFLSSMRTMNSSKKSKKILPWKIKKSKKL